MADKEKSLEQMQRELAEIQLEEARISLEQTREANAAYRQKREVSARGNAHRQRQFQADHDSLRKLQKGCAHMAGGDAGSNPTEGGGKFAFSTLSCTVMPDGKTKLLQDPRCRLMIYGRDRSPQEETKMQAAAEAVEKKDPANFMRSKAWLAWDDHCWWKDLYQLYRKEGLGKKSMMRGTTFTFEKDGMPLIPDITGYATSGAGGR